ncbi:hypothetical protein TNCV_638861 [Trichonephila clavipes]|nr:hypothetical protein TNCV_638861 [Trichonephila clavipes]
MPLKGETLYVSICKSGDDGLDDFIRLDDKSTTRGRPGTSLRFFFYCCFEIFILEQNSENARMLLDNETLVVPFLVKESPISLSKSNVGRDLLEIDLVLL